MIPLPVICVVLILCFFHTPEIYAQILSDSLKKELQTAQGEKKVDLLNELSREYEESDFERAADYSKQALALAEKKGYKKGVVKSFLNLSFLEQMNGNTGKGIEFIRKGIQVSEDARDAELLSECYYRLGGLFFTRGQLDSAEHYAGLLKKYAVEIPSEKMESNANHLFGMIYGTQGKYEKALESFFELLEYNTSINNLPNVAMHLKNIGHTYILLEKYDDALIYLERALTQQRRLNNKNAVCWTLANLGSCYAKKELYLKALPCYFESLEIAAEIGNPLLTIVNLNGIGQIYLSEKKYALAEEYLVQAFEKCQNYGENSHYIYVLNSLANLYLQTGQYDESVRYGEEFLDIAEKDKNYKQIIVARELLVKVNSETGNYKLALSHQSGLLDAKDSLFNSERAKLVEEMTARYGAKLKDQQIEALAQKKLTEENRKKMYAALLLLAIVMGSIILYRKFREVRENMMLVRKEEELSKLKSNFFANVTHEIRTPLSMIFAPLEQLKYEIRDNNQLRLLNFIHASSNRLLKLINQLLELSKIESGSESLKVSRQNIIRLINRQANLFESVALEKKIKLKINHLEERVDLFFDREKIETILTNLIYNAFKFNRKNGIVTIETFSQPIDGKEWFVCRISDTGMGIANEDLPYIFDRFFQSRNRKQNETGTGIGLSLCKELINLHHGTIEVESVVGKGTTFTFRLLPGDGHFMKNELFSTAKAINGNANPEITVANDKPVMPKEINQETEKPILLLIEDNSILRKYMIEILQRNYNLITAKNGADGIYLACQHVPDLIVSDIVMPEIDGYEVCRTLKNNELTSHIPIILVTGKSELNHRLEGLEAKADAYLIKPFVQKELLLQIKNLIDSREQWRKKYIDISRLKPQELPLNSIDDQFLKKIMTIIESNISNENFTVLELGKSVGLSRSQLHRKIKALLDLSPNEYIRSLRLHHAHGLLRQKAVTASEVAYKVGFTSPSYFTKCFREQFGYLPSEFYQKNHLLKRNAGEKNVPA